MAETIKTDKRKKPTFIRRDWYKRKRLGKKVKKLRKWRRAYGIHNKIRLKQKGYAKKPGVGYQEDKKLRGKVEGMAFERVENLNDLKNVKEKAIVIGRVGLKKRNEILKAAKEKGLKVLNKYKERKVKEKKNEKKTSEKKDSDKKQGEKNATK